MNEGESLGISMDLKDIIVRPAQSEDKMAVLNFCQHIWVNAEDYIAQVWDHWMADSSGQILVAVFADEPIAMTRVVQLSEQEGWWEALRVDPRYRGRGLVRCLDPVIEQYFQARGISTIRCCVATWNSAIPDIIQRRGYQSIACYLKHSAQAIAAPLRQLSQLQESDCQTVWQFIEQMQGTSALFVCQGAKWQTLLIDQLQARLQSRRVWGYRPQQELQGLLIQSHLESADSALWVGYVAGTTEGLFGLLEAMKHLAFHLKYPKVSGFFAKTNPLLKLLDRAGYCASPTDEFWVYEKQRSQRY